MTDTPLIAFRRFSLSRDGRRVLHDLTFEIPQASSGKRSLTVLLGPSGAGKSTLLKIATGQIGLRAPRLRSEGTVEVLGRPVQDWDKVALARALGFMQQETVLFAGTVGDNTARLRRLAGLPGTRAAHRDAARAALDAAGLAEIPLERRAAALSGGQRQRLAMARAAMMAPQGLLLDEPTTALDQETKAEILPPLLALAETTPLVAVTHDTDLLPFATRALYLAPDPGRPDAGATLRFDGPPEGLAGAGTPEDIRSALNAIQDLAETHAA
ncbi:MAG: ABC transporter ATP-binding protein [Pseudomonadota bacterium]